jgi:putative transposase
MDEKGTRSTRTSGMIPWRAGCGESRTSGSEGGPGKPTSRNVGRAPRSDPYTKLRGPVKWTWFYLYVILDIYSRYVVGWMLARAELASLAKALIEDSVQKQGVSPDQLTLHADRGSPMKAKPVAHLLADLGVVRSHSRPHTSNDNPYSESQFRTMKYRPEFPDRFGCFEDAHGFCGWFFGWYNDEHRHSGIGLHTPADVHYGRAETVLRGSQLMSHPLCEL